MFACSSCDLRGDVLGTRRRGAKLGAVETLYCGPCEELFDVPLRIDREAAEQLRPRLLEPWPLSANDLQLRLIGEVIGPESGPSPFTVEEMRTAPTSLGVSLWRQTMKTIVGDRNASKASHPVAAVLSAEAGLAPSLDQPGDRERPELAPSIGFGASAEMWDRIFHVSALEDLLLQDQALLGRWLDQQPAWAYVEFNEYGGRMDSYYNVFPACPSDARHPIREWRFGQRCPRCAGGRRPVDSTIV